jgi:hypothetical protein
VSSLFWLARHVAVACVLLLSPMPALAQEFVPPELAAKTVLRALAYDRALKGRAGEELLLAVVAKAGDAGDDAGAFAAALKALGSVTVQELPLRAVQVTAGSGAEAAAKLAGLKASVVYVGAGFDASEVAGLQAAALKAQALTTYRAPGYEEVLALGVLPRDGKLRIVVKLAAAKAAGAELDPQLLKLAQVK